MGASLQGGKLGNRRNRSGRKRRQRSSALMSEINVTPMVDVMLVLLIIFMVAAPMMTTGMQVDLPETKASALQTDEEPLSVSVMKDGKVFLNKSEIALEELIAKLEAVNGEKKKGETRIFVRGDKDADYGAVITVLARIHGAGFTKVALETDPAGK